MQRIRLLLLFFVLVIAVALGLWGGFTLRKFITANQPPQKILNTAAVLRQIQTLSQLVTVKFVLDKVVILEDVKWYGENRVLMVAHGVVKAGVDLSQIKPEDIRISNNRITLKVPRPSITDTYIDDANTQVVERSTGALRTFDKDLEQNARRQAIDDIRRAARKNGIIEEAEQRTKLQLMNLFHVLGFQDVEIKID